MSAVVGGFRPRHLLRGAGSLDRLPGSLVALGARRILLVTGGRSFEACGAARILAELRSATEVLRWSDVPPNPTVARVAAAVSAAQDHRPDAVVGIGGGSVLDTAKMVVGLLGGPPGVAGTPADASPQRTAALIRRSVPLGERTARLVLVPTTAGSGAEATPFATVHDEGEKRSVTGRALRADLVVLDERLVLSADAWQRANSGFDAVAQAVESLWAVGATPASRIDARRALSLLLPALRAFVAGDPDPRLPRAMLVGSHLAGRAIAVSRTTAAHALSYALTSDLGLPHGQAVGVSLPGLLRAAAEAQDEDLRVDPTIHRAAVAQVLAALGVQDARSGQRAMTALLEDIGLLPLPPRASADLRARATEFALRANLERLGNDPLRLGTARLAAVLTG